MELGTVLTNSVKRLLQGFSNNRNPRLLLLEEMPKHAVCAEIGVWKGDFSELILTMTSPATLHLIDPWQFQGEFPERMYGGTVAKNQSDMDSIHEGVVARFRSNPNVLVNKGKSESVLKTFADGYFDWVYIDGNHYYEFVRKDLDLCTRKVKPGGIIAGDDYTWGKDDGYPVKRAVQDFLKANNLRKRLKLIGSQFIIRR